MSQQPCALEAGEEAVGARRGPLTGACGGGTSPGGKHRGAVGLGR